MSDTFAIVSKLSSKAIEVQGGKAAPGTPIIMDSEASPPEPHQLWKLQHHGYGWYYVVSAMSDELVLDVQNFCTEPGVGLILWRKKYSGADNQLFHIDGDHIWSKLGHLVLDVELENPADGTRVITWFPKYDHTDSNQRWRIDGKFSIRSHMNGKVMDVKGGCAEPGTQVIMWRKNWPPTDNQSWEMKAFHDGWFQICSRMKENLVLCVFGGDHGSKVCVGTSNDPPDANQLFKVRGDHIVSAHGDLVLDIEGATKNHGASIGIWPAKNQCCDENQRWDIGYY